MGFRGANAASAPINVYDCLRCTAGLDGWNTCVTAEPLEPPRYQRICPYYRLPQLVPIREHPRVQRLPRCLALDTPQSITREQASSLCRSGEFPTCQWYQQSGSIAPERPFQIKRPTIPRASAPTVEGTATAEQPLSRQLVNSAVWVIGIPTAITLIIMLAIWITENVWMPTQTVLPGIIV